MKRILYSIVLISLLLIACNSQSVKKLSIQDAALIKAAKDGNLLAVQTALAEVVDANEMAITSQCLALIMASGQGHMDIVKFLLKKGADINFKTDTVWVMRSTSGYGHTGVVELMLTEWTENADVYVKSKDFFGVTALVMASQNGHTEVVKLLLENGADVNMKIKLFGETALWLASQNGHAEIVKLLLDKGADVNVKANDEILRQNFVGHFKGYEDCSVTALWMASQNGHPEVVKHLLAANADVNAANTINNATPLFIASTKGHIEVVKLLLEAKAEINSKSNLAGRDDTPLSIAKRMGHKQIVELLEKAGATEGQF